MTRGKLKQTEEEKVRKVMVKAEVMCEAWKRLLNIPYPFVYPEAVYNGSGMGSRTALIELFTRLGFIKKQISRVDDPEFLTFLETRGENRCTILYHPSRTTPTDTLLDQKVRNLSPTSTRVSYSEEELKLILEKLAVSEQSLWECQRDRAVESDLHELEVSNLENRIYKLERKARRYGIAEPLNTAEEAEEVYGYLMEVFDDDRGIDTPSIERCLTKFGRVLTFIAMMRLLEHSCRQMKAKGGASLDALKYWCGCCDKTIKKEEEAKKW